MSSFLFSLILWAHKLCVLGVLFLVSTSHITITQLYQLISQFISLSLSLSLFLSLSLPHFLSTTLFLSLFFSLSFSLSRSNSLSLSFFLSLSFSMPFVVLVNARERKRKIKSERESERMSTRVSERERCEKVLCSLPFPVLPLFLSHDPTSIWMGNTHTHTHKLIHSRKHTLSFVVCVCFPSYFIYKDNSGRA